MKTKNKHNFAVIFDLDGVIVDSNPFHKKAIQLFCQKHNKIISKKQLDNRILGRINKEWLTNLFKKEIISGEITLRNISKYSKEKELLFKKIYEPVVKPIKGLVNFLKLLKQNKITIAIATSAPISNVKFILKRSRTNKYFEVIFDSASIEKGKPNPEIYLKTAKKINFCPEKCIVIEDSKSGIKAAKKAKCKVIAITTTHSNEELIEMDLNIDLIIDNFDGLTIRNLLALYNQTP